MGKKLKVLGIDFSLNGTGLSLYDGKDVLLKKMFTVTKKHETEDPENFIFVPKMDNPMEKIDIVAKKIAEIAKKADFCLMEDHIGTYYNWMDGYGVVKYLLRQQNSKYVMASPTMIKKYAGNGSANKDMMSYFLKNDYGFDFDNLGKLANNIVDATWMAIIGYKYYKIFIEKDKSVLDSTNRMKILKTLASKNKMGD